MIEWESYSFQQSKFNHLQLASGSTVVDQRERSSSDLQYARNDARNDDNTPQSEYSHLQLASGLSVDDQRERPISDLQYASLEARNADINPPQSAYGHLQLASGLINVEDQHERSSYRLQQSEYEPVGASNYDTVDDFGAISQHLPASAKGLSTPLVNQTYREVQVEENDTGQQLQSSTKGLSTSLVNQTYSEVQVEESDVRFGFPLPSLDSHVVNANDDDDGYLVL
jgi:hypothetical protein